MDAFAIYRHFFNDTFPWKKKEKSFADCCPDAFLETIVNFAIAILIKKDAMKRLLGGQIIVCDEQRKFLGPDLLPLHCSPFLDVMLTTKIDCNKSQNFFADLRYPQSGITHSNNNCKVKLKKFCVFKARKVTSGPYLHFSPVHFLWYRNLRW